MQETNHKNYDSNKEDASKVRKETIKEEGHIKEN